MEEEDAKKLINFLPKFHVVAIYRQQKRTYMSKFFIRTYSFIKGNQDVVAMLILWLTLGAFSFVATCLYLGIAYNIIEISLKMILAFFLTLLGSLSTSIYLLYLGNAGMIAKHWQIELQNREKQIEKSKNDPNHPTINQYGVSLPGIENTQGKKNDP